jgi:hypothetical protein
MTPLERFFASAKSMSQGPDDYPGSVKSMSSIKDASVKAPSSAKSWESIIMEDDPKNKPSNKAPSEVTPPSAPGQPSPVTGRQTFDPTRYDSLGRALPIPEDGEVQDVTPKPPVIELGTLPVPEEKVKPAARARFVDILNQEYKTNKRPTKPVAFDQPQSAFTPGPIVAAASKPNRKAPQIKRPNESRGVKKIVSTKRMSYLDADLKTLVV